MTPARLWTTAALWGLLSVSLWASDAAPELLVLAGVFAAVAAAGFATFDLAQTARSVQWTDGQVAPPPDQLASRLRARLNATVRYDSPELQETLIALVDDRLLAHHGIDRAAAPETAATVLTPRLQRLAAGSRRGITAPRELQRILTDIEDL